MFRRSSGLLTTSSSTRQEDGAGVEHRRTTSFNEALAAGRAQALDEAALSLDDLAFLQYTGGTPAWPRARC